MKQEKELSGTGVMDLFYDDLRDQVFCNIVTFPDIGDFSNTLEGYLSMFSYEIEEL